MLIAILGAIALQGAKRNESRPVANITPQSGIDGSPPNPNKLKAALLMMQ